LAAAAEAMFAEDFAGRVLPFEARAAARYPEIVLARRQAGKPIEKFDALIAATALAAGASIATRDTGGFTGCGLTVIDPWTAS
jgi:predicted nucleic acid-binding protein